MGNSAGKVARGCTRDALPPYDQVVMTEKDLAVAGIEASLRTKAAGGGRCRQEAYEVAWAAARNAGVLVYTGPRTISVTRAYAILVSVVQGYSPATGQSTAVFDPVTQRITWHAGTPMHTPTWSVTSRWWRAQFAEHQDKFLPVLVAKQSDTPVEGLTHGWADELCRAISQHWHTHARYRIMGSHEEGFWVEFD